MESNQAKSEHRRLSRREPVNYIEIYRTDTDEFVGNLADLNVGGLKLVTQKKPVRDKTYRMCMRLPQPIGESDRIEFTAVCRWQTACSTTLLAGSYHAGFEIVDIAPLDADLISSLLTSSWFRDWRQLPDYERIRRETGYPEE